MEYEHVKISWQFAVKAHMICLEAGNDDLIKEGAREEIERCGKGLDDALLHIKKLEGFKDKILELQVRVSGKSDDNPIARGTLREALNKVLGEV